jgi:hypothetical protein
MPSRRLSRLAAVSGVAFFLAMGVATGILIGIRRMPHGSEVPRRESRFETGVATRTSTPGRPATEVAPGLPERAALSPPGPLALEDGLGRIRSIFAESSCPEECYLELGEIWKKIRKLALNDPATYLAFLRAPGNENACEGLLFVLYPHGLCRFFDEDLPAPILQGVADLMASGTKDQRLAAARLARDMVTRGELSSNHPSEDPPRRGEILVEPCLSLLSSDDLRARAAALDVMRSRRPERLEESLPLINDLWQRSSDDQGVRYSCLEAFAQSKSPAGTQFFYEKMSDVVREHPTESLQLIQSRLEAGRRGDVDRCGQLLLAALRSCDECDFQRIAAVSLDFPMATTIPILEEACASAPRPEVRDSVRRVLKEIEAGEVRSERLRAIINGH